MFKQNLDGEDSVDPVGTIDIETDGFDGRTNQLVAIGVGFYDHDRDTAEFEVVTRTMAGDDEVKLVENAFEWINRRDPEALVTYNGGDFDFPFLRDRLSALGVRDGPPLTSRHIDLYPPRKRAADKVNEKWPRLEECLQAYGLPVYETIWQGGILDGARFGEELAPSYLRAIENDDSSTISEIESTIFEYAASDVEANIALYEADVGREYEPTYNF